MKAELHRPWLLPVKAKKEFIVFEHIDINTPLLLVGNAASTLKQQSGVLGNMYVRFCGREPRPVSLA